MVSQPKNATELSDAGMIDEIITVIRSENVQLADFLQKLASDFAYDEILSLVNESTMGIGKKGET